METPSCACGKPYENRNEAPRAYSTPLARNYQSQTDMSTVYRYVDWSRVYLVCMHIVGHALVVPCSTGLSVPKVDNLEYDDLMSYPRQIQYFNVSIHRAQVWTEVRASFGRRDLGVPWPESSRCCYRAPFELKRAR